VTVAVATNCNPGSSYTTSMGFCLALAVRDLGMTIEEALQAATLGGAKALRREDLGRLAVGARADLVILEITERVPDGRRGGLVRHPPRARCAGPADQPRRLRHRLLLAGLPAAVSARRAQG